jgi:formamidopyrimidine-DNA glycosylase
MIELPESSTLAGQIMKELKGRSIISAIAGKSPHGFAFYHGGPETYGARLGGKAIGAAHHFGGRVEVEVEDMRLEFFDGVNMTLLGEGAKRPDKHQLLLEFDDGRALVCKVQMYGGLFAYRPGEMDNFYHTVAREKPDPLTDRFDRGYFDSLLGAEDKSKLSAKAFLATDQRIPGLGTACCRIYCSVAR